MDLTTNTKTALVTGGAGFIGSYIAKELINLDYNVIILDDLSGGFISNLPEKAVFIKGSILDEELVKHIFQKFNIDYVFHLAAYAAEGLSHFIRKYNYENNLIGSINLINESIKANIKCFVFTSSIAVYGEGQAPFKEDTIPKPEDPYGIAKIAVEMDLANAHRIFGLNYIIFRPHNVYGENQNIGDKYRNVIGIFMNRIMNHQSIPIFGDGEQTRAFSYIADVAAPIARSIEIKEAYNQIFNIGGDIPYNIKFLAELIKEKLGSTVEIKYLEARNEVLHAFADHSKAKKIFEKYINNIPIEVGITRMAKWALSVGSMQPSLFENIEIEKKLPPSWKKQIIDQSPEIEY